MFEGMRVNSGLEKRMAEESSEQVIHTKRSIDLDDSYPQNFCWKNFGGAEDNGECLLNSVGDHQGGDRESRRGK